MTKQNPQIFSEEGYRNYPHHLENQKNDIKKGEKMRQTQIAKRKAEKLINLRVKKIILKELHKNPLFRFIQEDNINFSFYDVPNEFKEDYRELINKIKEQGEQNA
jgi:hypothetical protein